MRRELERMTYSEVGEWAADRRNEIEDALALGTITDDMAKTLRLWVTEQQAMHLVASAIGLIKGEN